MFFGREIFLEYEIMTKLIIVYPIIKLAQDKFADLLLNANVGSGVSVECYQRYLSMQYHLTKGVQRYFITAAAHEDLFKMKPLRKFLLSFANEEERHYIVAANDLYNMGLEILPEPIDVTLWHSYFKNNIISNPFIRLGVALVLENISGGSARPLVKQALDSSFLNKQNTKFLVIHQHETLPHGDQILEALEKSLLSESNIKDICLGARQAIVLYLRLAEWALFPASLSSIADPDEMILGEQERAQINNFTLSELSKDSIVD